MRTRVSGRSAEPISRNLLRRPLRTRTSAILVTRTRRTCSSMSKSCAKAAVRWWGTVNAATSAAGFLGTRAATHEVGLDHNRAPSEKGMLMLTVNIIQRPDVPSTRKKKKNVSSWQAQQNVAAFTPGLPANTPQLEASSETASIRHDRLQDYDFRSSGAFHRGDPASMDEMHVLETDLLLGGAQDVVHSLKKERAWLNRFLLRHIATHDNPVSAVHLRAVFVSNNNNQVVLRCSTSSGSDTLSTGEPSNTMPGPSDGHLQLFPLRIVWQKRLGRYSGSACWRNVGNCGWRAFSSSRHCCKWSLCRPSWTQCHTHAG